MPLRLSLVKVGVIVGLLYLIASDFNYIFLVILILIITHLLKKKHVLKPNHYFSMAVSRIIEPQLCYLGKVMCSMYCPF